MHTVAARSKGDLARPASSDSGNPHWRRKPGEPEPTTLEEASIAQRPCKAEAGLHRLRHRMRDSVSNESIALIVTPEVEIPPR